MSMPHKQNVISMLAVSGKFETRCRMISTLIKPKSVIVGNATIEDCSARKKQLRQGSFKVCICGVCWKLRQPRSFLYSIKLLVILNKLII